MTDTTLVARWVRPSIRSLAAYHVPDASGLVKLDAMENPYHWPPELVDAWLETLRNVALNRYPDPRSPQLIDTLRRVAGIPADQSVILGNGSDELIQVIIMALAGPGRVVMSVEPSFVMYRMIAGYADMDYVGVPLGEGFALDREAFIAAMQAHEPAVVFLAYPNNPTGNRFAREDMEAVIEAAPGLVVVDEAYAPFADDSFLGDLGRYPNLVVMRTVSKQGLAGLRLGYLCGPRAWLEQFDKLRLPYNINVLTQASAAFALDHHTVLDEQAAAIRRDRESLMQALAEMPGVIPYPSEANFILCRVPAGQGDRVFEGLKSRGVLIKNLSPQGGPLTDCLRVTVGRPDENERFLAALGSVLGQ
ncbi:histidinol-phosphate transaminase [Thioalkalivibrio denitrificans]|uniref:Histidinol-phosphate aminotransferase n=1 Tax=Thioalkalivibrio denitrificans TaxID=108003 RepID=A0A1V3NN50_9GAMM|nr:histidinol-phosphate transaminase [Thioalkalivibrio denitrificans]OOG26480.1 histidinol-phosphate transaminase [Thioalkalivibrio denitrificans]